MRVKNLLILFGIIFALSSFALAVVPSGVTPVEISSSSAPSDVPTSVPAIAGNVTELNIEGFTNTQTWQGYFGNVSGTIQLADSSDNVLYNWSLANPEGEVYASINSSVDWGNIDCFNWTTNGVALETEYNIGQDDVDGVNETFAFGNGHDLFYASNILFTEGQCMSTKVYDNSQSGVDNHFEEVLLWDGDAVVFASLLEEASVLGFDGRDHDFEMLVLEDGHGADTSTTPYYFYVELQ